MRRSLNDLTIQSVGYELEVNLRKKADLIDKSEIQKCVIPFSMDWMGIIDYQDLCFSRVL